MKKKRRKTLHEPPVAQPPVAQPPEIQEKPASHVFQIVGGVLVLLVILVMTVSYVLTAAQGGWMYQIAIAKSGGTGPVWVMVCLSTIALICAVYYLWGEVRSTVLDRKHRNR